MVKQCLLEGKFAADIDDVASNVGQVTLGINEASATVNCLTMSVHDQKWLTTRVHLDIANDTVDVEASEGEDFGELAIILELGLQDEDFSLAGADVPLVSHNVASLVDHDTSLVDIDLVAAVISAE